MEETCLTKPDPYTAAGMASPFSRRGEMLYTASTIAQTAKTDASARFKPTGASQMMALGKNCTESAPTWTDAKRDHQVLNDP